MAKTIEEMAVRDTAVIVGEPHDYYIMGANAVLDIIEQALTLQKCHTDIGIDVSPEALIKTALQTIEELKNK